jgi:glycerol kinase
MVHVLALDQGTTSSRALLFDADGVVRSVAQREVPPLYPQPGWVEHDPLLLWSSQIEVARQVVAEAGVAWGDVAALAVTNQRETTVVWERASGRPVGNAIVWQDRRTAPACDALRAEGRAALIAGRTGLVIDPYFSATKIGWLLDHVDGARAAAEAGRLCFGTVDSWLIWNLTGGRLHVTDASNAARTMLFDIRRRAWDDELLALFGVPRAMLPEVRSSSEVLGETAPGVLPAAVPIAGVAGDQQAALFGQLCLQPGMAKTTYGTGCFLLLNTGDAAATSRHGLVATVGWCRGGACTYALEGSVFVAGAAVQWLRDGLALAPTAAGVEALARTVDCSGGVHLVPAFVGLGAPHWDPHARGLICGLTRGTTKAHLARAALDAIAHQVADVVAAMESDAGFALTELRVDGGAAVSDLLLQIQADLLGIPIVRPRSVETTALGAALLAGLAVGVWRDGDLARLWVADRRFEPSMSADRVGVLRAGWLDAVARARGRAVDAAPAS